MPKALAKTPTKPAAKKVPAKSAPKAKAPSKEKEVKISASKEKDTKVLKADELMGG